MLRQGFAKAFFTDIYQRSPWLSTTEDRVEHHWPFLDILLAQKRDRI